MDMKIKINTKKVMEIVDELIFYSTITKLSTWISCYLDILNLPGDLFLIKQSKLKIDILPSEKLLKLQKEARRRYEKLD